MMLRKETRSITATESSAPFTKMRNMKTFKRNNDQASMRIRSRYLHRLGVVDLSTGTVSSSSASCDSCSVGTTTSLETLKSKGSPKRKHVRRRSRPDEIQFQPLKGCDGEDENQCSSSSHPSRRQRSQSESSTSTSVSFENFVVVHPIPNRDAYSEDMKEAIWTNPEEMRDQMMRNYAEFASEGMMWQNTLEEEDFFVYNDELVHPVHIMHRHCSLQQDFLMQMRARQASQ